MALPRHLSPRQRRPVHRWLSSTTWVSLGVAALALPTRIATALADIATADESLWLDRSSRFFDAIRSGDLAAASAAHGEVVTMPGVTTMWIGSVARAIRGWGMRSQGWWLDSGDSFAVSPRGLDIAQVVMAVVTSLLIGYLTFLVARWAGLAAGLVAGVLLATEPFLVAHGAVLHTDELLALCSVAGMVSLCLALGIPHGTAWAGRWWAAAVAGALFGAAFLTKLTAVAVLPAVACVLAGVGIRALRDREASPWDALRPVLTVAAGSLAGAVLVIVTAYPALWVQPGAEVSSLRQSAALGGTGHVQFFRGEVTPTPGLSFYPVALPLRMTPWLFVGFLLAAVGLWIARSTRGMAVVLALLAGSFFVTLAAAEKQFDRYGLPLVVIAAVAVGIAAGAGVSAVSARLDGRSVTRMLRAGAAIVLVGAAFINASVVAPWGLAYFNPALGGSATAESTVLIGWGEGLEYAGDLIAAREGGRCRKVTIWTYNDPLAFPCGTLVPGSAGATYVVVYVGHRQRFAPHQLARLTDGRDLLATLTIRGITYAQVFGPQLPDE